MRVDHAPATAPPAIEIPESCAQQTLENSISLDQELIPLQQPRVHRDELFPGKLSLATTRGQPDL